MKATKKEKKLESQIRKQRQLIKRLKSIIKIYAPYMKFE